MSVLLGEEKDQEGGGGMGLPQSTAYGGRVDAKVVVQSIDSTAQNSQLRSLLGQNVTNTSEITFHAAGGVSARP